MIKVGLMGFDFNSPNKGCEALSYTFIDMLSKFIDSDLEVNVFSYGDLGKIPEKYPNIKFVWHQPHMKNPVYWMKLLKKFNTYSCIFDITYGDGFSDIYGKVWNANTDMAKHIANMSKAPFILLPQTYGPYKSKFLRNWAVRIVKNSSLAFSRDKLSADEMKALGCDKIKATTDLAFALPYDKNLYSFNNDKLKIGLNVSSLLWDGGHNIKLATNYIEYCNKLISEYESDKNTEVHLIPHVIDKNNFDSLENDSRVCKLLHDNYPYTVLAPDFETPVEAKSYISNMDVFIGARMHSTIGAMSAGVPVIPFSYSKKFEGLFGNLNYPYILSATKINTADAVSQTKKYIQERNLLELARKKSMDVIEGNLDIVRREVENIIGG